VRALRTALLSRTRLIAANVLSLISLSEESINVTGGSEVKHYYACIWRKFEQFYNPSSWKGRKSRIANRQRNGELFYSSAARRIELQEVESTAARGLHLPFMAIK